MPILRVLLIDGDERVVRNVKRQLATTYAVTCASNAIEGASLATQASFDAIVADADASVGDKDVGWFLRAIGARRAKRTILMTANSNLRAGSHPTLTKPFSTGELLYVLDLVTDANAAHDSPGTRLPTTRAPDDRT